MKPPKSVVEIAPEGVHKAVCIQVIDMGTQTITFKGKPKDVRKLHVGFELLGKRKKNGDPFTVNQRFTFSASPKAILSKTLKSWLGVKDPEKFDMGDMLGQGGLVTVTHSDDGEWANITNITGLPAKQKVGEPENEMVSLFLDETFDQDVYESLWDKMKEAIASSPEFDELNAPKPKKAKGGKK